MIFAKHFRSDVFPVKCDKKSDEIIDLLSENDYNYQCVSHDIHKILLKREGCYGY